MQFLKTILVLSFLLISELVNAQTIISGLVVDKKGEPIVGANVYLENSYDGATTIIDGNFSFSTKEIGKQTLIVSNLNYQTYRVLAEVNTMNGLHIALKEAVNSLDAVVLTAGSFKAGGTNTVSVMSPLDVVTTAGVAGDFIGALQTLPGTQTVGEDGRLFVRGGTADETGVYIDGLQVFKPYISTSNNSPTRGRYSPFLFDGITFSTGGYSAEYGNALSSVLLLNTINEPKQNETNISLMSLGVGVGHTKKWEKDALTINATYINLAPYNKLVPDSDTWNKLPESIASEAVYRHNTKNGLFKFYTAYDYSKFDVEQENINFENRVRFKLKDSNWYTNFSYDGFIGNDLKLTTGLSYSNSNKDIGFESTDVNNIENALHLKAKLKHSFSNAFKLSYGVELTSIDFRETGIANQTENFEYSFSQTMSSLFTESEIFFSNNFAGKFGIRGEYNALLKDYAFSPRVSLAYRLNKQSQLSFAYGDFYQTPQNNELKIDQNLNFQKATHYILNYQYNKNRQLFRVEIYYKDYAHLLQYNTEFNQPSGNFSNNGFGFAKGIDLFWKDSYNIKNLQYWFSYSYLDTERKYRDFPNQVTPSFATKHNASLVTKYWINDWRSQIGATYSFASGRPFDNPNANQFMSGKTKTYNNLSVNWSYLISQQKILFVSVSNILGIKNTYGYNYANAPDVNGVFKRQAIIPSADRFFFIGFFWTISDDKSKNQLDNL